MVARSTLASLALVACAFPAQDAAKPGAGQAEAQAPREPEMARIAGATFRMGNPIADPDAEGFRHPERPQRDVHVEEFWLARFLVTAEEFCLFLNEAGNRGYFHSIPGFYDYRTIQRLEDDARLVPKAPGDRYVPRPGAERAPAYPIRWPGAVAYCKWLSEKLGHEFRLPTEAEWELAARGPELRAWPWGEELPLLVDYSGRSFPSWRNHVARPDDTYRVADPGDQRLPSSELYGRRWIVMRWEQRPPWPAEPVGNFPKNATPDGVHDLLGYVAGQWCADRAERAIARLPGTREPMYVTRGRSNVVTGYDQPPRPLLTKLLLWIASAGQEHGEYDNTPGRSWSRVGEHKGAGMMFRVASSSPPPSRR